MTNRTIVKDALNFRMKKVALIVLLKKTKKFLDRNRAEQIVDNLKNEGYFPCHKTIDYKDNGNIIIRKGSSHCAGSVIVMLREVIKSSWKQICERLSLQDYGNFDMEDDVDESFEDFINKHKK